MRDYIVDCDYCEESDIGLINRKVRVTVRASDFFDALHKAQDVVPGTLMFSMPFEKRKEGEYYIHVDNT